MSESQLTFTDIANSKQDSEVYSIITEIASKATEGFRDRAGDNCPTIAEIHDSSVKYEFAVKLPPHSDQVEITDITDYEFNLQTIERKQTGDTFVIITTSQVYLPSVDSSAIIHFIYPADDAKIDEENDMDRTVYDSFDFKKFLENWKEEDL